MAGLIDQQDQKKLISALLLPGIALIIMWLIELSTVMMDWNRGEWGVIPRTLTGLKGIITMVWVHGGWEHLGSNSVPFLVLSAAVLYLYDEIAIKVLVFSYLIPGIWVWAMARPNAHIGASGFIFALAFFLFFSGIIRKEKRTLALALVVSFLYGGMIWGIFPGQEGISWEGHLFGALTGILLAIFFRKQGPQKKSIWDQYPESNHPSDEMGSWNYKDLYPPPEGFKYPDE